MPDRPDRATDARLTVVILPGASLMDVRPLADGMALVRCPGCGATRLIAATLSPGVVVSHLAFVHKDDHCPVLARIEAALAWLRTAQAAESN